MMTPNTDINDGFLVKHALKLVGLTIESAQSISSDIESMTSVESAAIDMDNAVIHLSYDASCHNIDEMREIFLRYDCDVAPDHWNQFKLSWDRNVDKNVYDNANHKPLVVNKLTH